MTEINLPGQELEKAVAGVGSNAGNTLVQAFGRRLKAWSARASAEDEAEAAETKKNIAHAGALKREAATVEARRKFEIEELQHRAALLARGIGRLQTEIEKGQRQVEYVGDKALRITEQDPDRDAKATIDDDWLATFFKYVAQVDEAHVLDVLARALADAAVGRPVIPAKALDTLRFFDTESYAMFRFAARMLTLFEALPDNTLETLARREGTAFDASRLSDLGLLTVEPRRNIALSIGNVRYVMGYGPAQKFELKIMRLTFAGRAIAMLLSPHQRRLVEANQSVTVLGDQMWSLQDAIGLSPRDVEIVATTLIQQLCDTWSIRAQFVVPEPKDIQSVNRIFERESLSEPFGYGGVRGIVGLEPANAALLDAFVTEFDRFDEYQLPVIINHQD